MKTHLHAPISNIKVLFIILGLAIAAVGCESTEQFVTREAGLWNVTTQNVKDYQDSVLVSDLTQTSNLGTMEFLMNGSGYRTVAAVRDTFVWQLNSEDDRLIVYYKIGPFMNAEIQSRSDKAMTLFWEYESAVGTTHYKTSKTATIERAQ